MPEGLAFIVDHNLRPKSADEAAQAAKIATALGHEPQILPLSWSQTPTTQAHYRHARYRALAKACARHKIDQLWTGHHSDDQAETLFLRLSKGSGLMGLSGMAFAQPFGTAWLARPLLSASRRQIEDWLRQRKYVWITDPSNANPRYLRTHARACLSQNPEWKPPLLDLATRVGRLRQEAIDAAAFIPLHRPTAGLIAAPKAALEEASTAVQHEWLRACVQWCGGQAFPALQAHLHLLRHGKSGQRSTGGGVVMELGAEIRFAPEVRGTRNISLADLAAKAMEQRAHEKDTGLWFPKGRNALPFVPAEPQMARWFAPKALDDPLSAKGRIEVLPSFPISK